MNNPIMLSDPNGADPEGKQMGYGTIFTQKADGTWEVGSGNKSGGGKNQSSDNGNEGYGELIKRVSSQGENSSNSSSSSQNSTDSSNYVELKVVEIFSKVQVGFSSGRGTYENPIPLKDVAIKSSPVTSKSDGVVEGSAPSFDRANSYTAKYEGGWVNDPADPGGATNRGIIFSNFKKWAKSDLGIEPTLGNLKSLTAEQAKTLYKKHFWDSQNFGSFKDGSTAFAIYDFSVNSGKGIRTVESAFNAKYGGITVDGKLTVAEINHLNEINGRELFNLVQDTRRSYLRGVIQANVNKYLKKHPNATQAELQKRTLLRFEKGLFKRVNSIRYE